ncbi:hypothetical protein [Ralstonia phage phiRSL1]|uniref:Uncharacterized protein n=1 Tax=Ralstonia phage phiRSL1 TaxID=1980924 RepID=B2ZXT8_9CAUD|nr:hypothetical protein RSL1_ORF068 [Ralstonia phage phiRSL1]BAG41514.1 hypothetical protein [Ralstonia phage phiRSL1]
MKKMQLRQVEAPPTFPVIRVSRAFDLEVTIEVELATRISKTSVWLWTGLQEVKRARITRDRQYFDAEVEGPAAHALIQSWIIAWQQELDAARAKSKALASSLQAFKTRGYKIQGL